MIKKEKRAIKDYFGQNVEPAPLELDEAKLEDLKTKGLECHFLPQVTYEDFPKGSLSDYFLKLAKQSSLRDDSLGISPGWRLVETEPKPPKGRIWLYKNPLFDFIEKLGVESRGLCGLSPELKSVRWNELEKRIGTTREEIDALLAKDFNLRSPTYLEYVYLGECFYNDWGETKTWEWLRDELEDGRYLAAGFKRVKSLGADPPDHWSTILGYRLILELNPSNKAGSGGAL